MSAATLAFSMGRYDLSVFQPRHHLLILSAVFAATAVATTVAFVWDAAGLSFDPLSSSVLGISVFAFISSLSLAYAGYTVWYTSDNHADRLTRHPLVVVAGPTVALSVAFLVVEFAYFRTRASPSAVRVVAEVPGSLFLSAYVVYSVYALIDTVSEYAKKAA